MFRLWGKIWKDNHMIKDTVICDDSEDTRTHKIFHALQENDFKRHSKTRFYQDNFVETVDFDYLEIQVIEED